MKAIKKHIYIIITLIILFPSILNAKSEDAEIKNLLLSKKDNNIFISFSVRNAFTKEILKIIQSGIPVTFSFDIEVKKNRLLFPDKTIFKKEIIHKVKYSNLTKTYFIKKPYISEEPYLIHSEKMAKKEMTGINDLSLSLPKLEKGAKYKVKVRARLREITLPFYLHKIFFFLSVWDFKTSWSSMDIKF